jgi:ParB family chromosome partitioning protein
LQAIDLADRTFAFVPPADLGTLTASLQEVGLLAPPWLRQQEGERWQVVAGWKRLLAAAQLGWPQVPARLLPRETSDSHCLLLYLHDNAFTREFNPLEQARLAARLLEYWERGLVLQKFLPLLRLPPTGAFLDRLLAVAQLEPPWQQLVAQERLALPAAARLGSWTLPDREAVHPFLENLALSHSLQMEFLEGIELLARRDGVSAGKVLSRVELQHPLQAGGTPREKAAAIRSILQHWLYPRLLATRETFQAALGRLGLRQHPRVQLQPPPAFEGPDFRLEVKFQDLRELQKLLAEVLRLTDQEDFTLLTTL